MNRSTAYLVCALAIGGAAVGCDKPEREAGEATPETTSATTPADQPAPAAGAPERTEKPTQSEATFTPPPESEIPDNEYGQTVLQGKNLFVNTQQYAKGYVGNGMNCTNCHLDNGRQANSAPLWAAYVLYPAYRKKTGQVDTIQSRIQGCFLYSMNGRPPALDSKEMTALVTYHYWLAKGAPTGVKLPGQGYLSLPKPEQTPDITRGRDVYQNNCAICHGANGEGMQAKGTYAFPPLWGKDSFNWGAGMHRIDTAAGFIKANMPYGLGGTLSDQEAWDVALFMNSHERPQDPRRTGKSLAQTRDQFHDENCLYGRTPEELAAALQKKQAQAKPGAADDNATPPVDPLPPGYSPAKSHELPPTPAR